MSGSINQFQAPVAVQTDTTIRITETRQENETIGTNMECVYQNNMLEVFCSILAVTHTYVFPVLSEWQAYDSFVQLS